MHFVVFATHKEEMGQERLQLQDAFRPTFTISPNILM